MNSPFYCNNGFAHSWFNTGERRVVWYSTGTGEEPPENAPKEYEQGCTACKLTRWVSEVRAATLALKSLH